MNLINKFTTLAIFFGLSLLLHLSLSMSHAHAMPGGFGDASPAGPEEQQLIDQVRGEVEANVGRHFSEYHAERYVTQVVAGTNYIVATKVDGSEYLHIKLHKPLPFRNLPPHLMAVRAGKTASDPLEYFE